LRHRRLRGPGGGGPPRADGPPGGAGAGRRRTRDRVARGRRPRDHDRGGRSRVRRDPAVSRSHGHEAGEPQVDEGDVAIVTFGCRLNAYESEVIRARAAEDGLTNAVVFNTCAVTGEAVRQARQAIRRARRERPDAKLIVTGCAAQIDPAAFAGMGEVDLVLGNAEKSQAGAYAPASEPGRVRVNDIMSVRETAGHLIDGLKDRARAYVEVQ